MTASGCILINQKEKKKKIQRNICCSLRLKKNLICFYIGCIHRLEIRRAIKINNAIKLIKNVTPLLRVDRTTRSPGPRIYSFVRWISFPWLAIIKDCRLLAIGRAGQVRDAIIRGSNAKSCRCWRTACTCCTRRANKAKQLLGARKRRAWDFHSFCLRKWWSCGADNNITRICLTQMGTCYYTSQ